MIVTGNSKGWTFYTFQVGVVMIWISYYLAIMVAPGSPPPDFKVNRTLKPQEYWYKYCVKCKADKPERAHHCKRCGRCVLKMDHHCPWTAQCVGHDNFPHFLRFLVWVLATCAIGLKYTFQELRYYWRNRNLPSYYISQWQVALIIVVFILFVFLEFSIGILFIRTCITSLFSNVSMIEDWENDRVQHVFFRDTFWTKVRANYARVHGKKMPQLTSWKSSYRELRKDSSVPLNFTFEDITFQYDQGSALDNAVAALGPVYQWLWPWGGPQDDGLYYNRDLWREEDQLRLPFPIDGGNFEPNEGDVSQSNVTDDDREDVIYEGNWANDLGETLNDFGVDETTEYESLKHR